MPSNKAVAIEIVLYYEKADGNVSFQTILN